MLGGWPRPDMRGNDRSCVSRFFASVCLDGNTMVLVREFNCHQVVKVQVSRLVSDYYKVKGTSYHCDNT